MYIYMGMFFNSQQDVPDFGSIAMYYVGTKDLGYVEEGHKRFRKYTFQSTDLNKLSLITNAIDGSEAYAVDTGTTYVLYNGEWNIKSSELTPAKMTEILGDITSIDYQIVAVLPITGTNGTIYLVNNNHGENDIYDEYIWVNGAYEKIGNTGVDLGNYIQKVLNANNKVPKFDSNGNLVSTGYELNKTVPADAVFTDTTYTLIQDQLDGYKMTFTPSNGNSTIITIPNNNTTYEDATQSMHGLMSASDKIKLDNITGISNNTKFEFCTANEYSQMVNRTAAIYFILNDSTLLIKDANDNLLTLSNTEAESAEVKIYGWHVDPDTSYSSNAVTYLEDAIGMTPASMGSTTFNYGSWENAFFMPKPCMLKSNGKVDYYLDPNDYTKKADGTASDIANPNYDGNAMMQWPKIWFKYVKGVKEGQGYFYVANYKADGNFHCWCNYDSENNEIDHFYTAIYNGTSFTNDTAPTINKMRSLSGVRLTANNGNAQTTTATEITNATANNTTSAVEWYIETFSDRLLINGLLVLMGKLLNTRTVFGRGLDTGGQSAKEAYVTGTLNDKGLFWGATGNGNSGVKVFGMENFWGCCWHRVAGLITDNYAVKLKLTYGTKDGSTVIGYNQTGNGYINNGAAPYSDGYIQKMSYNEYGFMPATVTGGNQSTYYGDYYFQNTNYTGITYATFGGCSVDNLRTGAFCCALSRSPEFAASWHLAASLSCKPLLN